MPVRSIPISVCIGTYGDRHHWGTLAERALASVERQTRAPISIRWVHGATLQEARNAAASAGRHRSDWIVFLDADDELDEQYLEAMYEVVHDQPGPILVQPATLGVYDDGHEDDHPVLIPPKPLLQGNFMVIGTLIRRDQFEQLGGFDDWPYAEDWDLWIRAWRDGAQLLRCPEAIYRVHVNPNGRNSCDVALQIETYNKIRSRHAGLVQR